MVVASSGDEELWRRMGSPGFGGGGAGGGERWSLRDGPCSFRFHSTDFGSKNCVFRVIRPWKNLGKSPRAATTRSRTGAATPSVCPSRPLSYPCAFRLITHASSGSASRLSSEIRSLDWRSTFRHLFHDFSIRQKRRAAALRAGEFGSYLEAQ